MPDYRRNRVAGGTYFFTITCLTVIALCSWSTLNSCVARRCAAWPFSSFHKSVAMGLYPRAGTGKDDAADARGVRR
jgi:hypothetical protein